MRAVSAAALICLAVAGSLAGCDLFRGAPAPSPSASGARAPVPSRPSGDPARAAKARARVPLDLATRRRLRLAPSGAGAARIAFGKDRLGIIVRDELVVRDLAYFFPDVRVPVAGARAVTGLADGSLLALGAARSVRLLPGERKAKSYQPISLVPRESVFPDRRFPERVWVLSGAGTTVFTYDLGASSPGGSFLVPAGWVDLEGFDGHAFASIRDGSFVYTAPTGLVQFWGAWGKTPVKGQLENVFRLLPGSRTDTVWALTREDATLFRILAGSLYRLTTVRFETMPLDAAAAGDFLVVLELNQPATARWSFVLEGFDVRGARRLRADLTADESLDDDWYAKLVRNRNLAVASDPALVVVGGPDHLSAWSAEDGRPRYDGP